MLCILLTPLPSGRQIFVLMIWVDETKAQKQTVLEFVGVLLLLLRMERRAHLVWHELKVKVIKRRGVNTNVTPKEGVGEKVGRLALK